MPRVAILSAGLLVSCCATFFTATAWSQPAGATKDMPAVQQSSGGIRYLSGGAGDEERRAMDQRRAEFPLKVVMSAGSGEYIVAEKLSLVSAQGEVLVVRDAGPVVMIGAPQGSYSVDITYEGKTQRHPARIGAAASTLSVRFPSSR